MNLIFMINHSKLLHISKVDYFQIEAQVCYAFYYNFQKFSDNWRRISINWWQHIFLAGCVPEPPHNTHLVSISDSLELAMSSLSLVSCLLTLRPGDRLKVRRLQSSSEVLSEASGNVNFFQCKEWLCIELSFLLRSDLGLSGTRVSGSSVCTGR